LIVRLNRIGGRCRSALHAVRLVTRVLFVALRGLYRSWHLQDQAADPTFQAADPTFRRARHAAYRQLWAMLENVYWKLRESNSDASTLRTLLLDVDTLLAQIFLYIRESDQALLGQYVQSLQRLGAAAYALPKNEPVAWENAAPRAPDGLVDIDSITQEAVDLRNRVLQQVRRVLSSD
jgi:hypothetical protein